MSTARKQPNLLTSNNVSSQANFAQNLLQKIYIIFFNKTNRYIMSTTVQHKCFSARQQMYPQLQQMYPHPMCQSSIYKPLQSIGIVDITLSTILSANSVS